MRSFMWKFNQQSFQWYDNGGHCVLDMRLLEAIGLARIDDLLSIRLQYC